MTVTPQLVLYLRERYGHQCRVCGDQLRRQDSLRNTWACSGWEETTESPGLMRRKAGRTIADAHYRDSVTHNLPPYDEGVIAVIDALEELTRKLRAGSDTNNI